MISNENSSIKTYKLYIKPGDNIFNNNKHRMHPPTITRKPTNAINNRQSSIMIKNSGI